jgi:ABC-type branched-subunit amino acid transport system ATPase component/ABC-type branched-subunit amino acid transport system permease subunit
VNPQLRQWPYVLASLCAAMFVPQLITENYWFNIINLGSSLAIVCLGLTILLGYTGQISLAQAAFWGIGAYTSALLTVKLGFPVWAGMIFAAIVAAFFGILLGIPSLKLSGHYLAVTTIGFGFIVQLVLINWIDVTGGSDGITQIPSLNLMGFEFNTEKRYFYFSSTLTVLLVWAAIRLKTSRMGRALLAVRQNEMAASTNGIDVTRYKIIAFILSSAYAGLAGSLFAHGGAHYISPDTFSFEQSVLILAMTVLGGDGSAIGAVLGAMLLTLLPETLRFLKDIYLIVFAAAIVLIMIYMPGGVANLVAQAPIVVRWRNSRRNVSSTHLLKHDEQLPSIDRHLFEFAERELLKIEGLAKHFGGLKAVDKVDMVVQRGSVHALIGPNGSGKTTIINMLSGLYVPTSGKIKLNGKEIDGAKPHEISKFGISRTFQNIRLFPELSTLENVLIGQHGRSHIGLFGCIVQGPSQHREEALLRQHALKWLNFVGLKGVETEKAKNLPYGRQRLLEVARALASEPILLLLDEPAAGLNAVETEQLRELLEQIRQMGVTILLVEHDMELVMSVSDTISVLNFGRLIAEGDENYVSNHPEVISAYLGQEMDIVTN